MARTPPSALISGLNAFRGGLQRLRQATVPASVAVIELGFGGWLTQAMSAAVRLGITDALADGPLTAAEVARRVHTDPSATYRLMRALASNSVLKLRRDGRFALTRIGRALVSDDPAGVAPMITFIGHPAHREHWSNLEHSVRTGETAVDKIRGMPFFEYLDTDPELAQVFNDAMTGASAVAIESAVPAYDFSSSKLIVDVGGGHGALLAAVLRQAPDARGVLFDLPQVVTGAGPAIAEVASRCDIQGGSFFESVPAGDTYLLKTVIHDWDDERACAILRNVRNAITPGGKLLLFEMVLPEGAPAHLGLLLDLEMLVAGGGKERTRREYAELLSQAGFELQRVVPTTSPLAIVEARPI
ncbi:methyltransferase [Mycolicibacter longobardus]|uniref:Hydroxyneurosporene methyltransferase n=1 Tax=Mycolicibacter longobardus TaxID=1108812 RepID=A0A1X1YP39_9MYCO|nr:methyltransferase [Mycolicibacter longobardus]MCV7384276.1 helix-turn-helix domain-containing protein [Mycolicibacter longobardus]ORW12771.1 hydroxyneurosporene methyltransferase [Mycolicibacter longobardus]